MLDIKTVTVIGANGTMGRNIAAIFAAFGDCKVYMVCRTLQKARDAVGKSVASVKADSVAINLIPTDTEHLEECAKKSDLIIEQVKEDLEIKKALFKQISPHIGEKTLVCSGTSGLSITTLAECLEPKYRKNCFGLHMFNPPYSMTLCELVTTKYTNNGTMSALKEYLSKKLLRSVVTVKDTPAFLANRIGFQFINKALQYAEKYKDNGGIDYIDAILGRFSGRLMPPLATADFVGLDVHKAIVDNIYENTNDCEHETFACPDFVKELINGGRLGKKSGSGLFKSVETDGKPEQLVYDISTRTYRKKIKYEFPFVNQMIDNLQEGSYDKALKALVDNHSKEAVICLDFLLGYISYSLKTVKEVGFDVESVDDAMATGFNWCPPLALAEALRGVCDKKLLPETDKKSKYDFRSFFKAKK